MPATHATTQQNSPPQTALEQALRTTPPANDLPTDRPRLRLAVRAIQEQRVCLIRYASEPGGAICLRAIEPLTITSNRGALAVLAWCRLRRDLRTFRLDRIRNIVLTAEQFDDHPARALERFIQGRRCELRKHDPHPLR